MKTAPTTASGKVSANTWGSNKISIVPTSARLSCWSTSNLTMRYTFSVTNSPAMTIKVMKNGLSNSRKMARKRITAGHSWRYLP